MRNHFRSLTLLLLTITTSACSYIPFAGGALEGKITPPLADWTAIAEIQIVQLETHPQDPYSVKVWMVAMAEKIFVYAGDNHAQWAQYIDTDPKVRLKAGDQLFELTAMRVTDEAEFQVFANAWLAKYGSDRTDSTALETYLYRLSPRSKAR